MGTTAVDYSANPGYDCSMFYICFIYIYIFAVIVTNLIMHIAIQSFGVRTASGQYDGSESGARLTLLYDLRVYQCEIDPTEGFNTDYLCTGSSSEVGDCNFYGGNNNEIFIESFSGGDALILDRLYVTPATGNQITITPSGGNVCLSTDGALDGCPAEGTIRALVDLDSSSVDYNAVQPNGKFKFLIKKK